MMFGCVLALLGLNAILTPTEARADGCRTITRYNTPVVAVQQQYYNGVTYNQQYGYITVPKAFFAHVAEYRPVYLGISDDYRQKEFAKEVAEQLAKIQNAQPRNGPGPNNFGKPQSKIGAILDARCVSCHGAGKTEPDLSGDPDTISELVRLKSFAEVAKNKMPKKGPPLPQEELDELGKWSELKPLPKIPNLTIPPKETIPDSKK